MMHWDMPYGKGLADWDGALLTDMEVESLFQQLNVINRARNHCLVLGCVWHDVGRMRTAMAANGYLDIHPLFVYKPMQNTSGMEWISAVETLVVGYKGGIKACNLTFKEIHPVFRHNLLFGHQVGPKRKFPGELVEVNTTQKNPNTASALGRIMCSPGATALLLGAGSGSEVLGLARVGVNVVAVERDSKQFRALCERVSSEAAFPDEAKKKLAEDDRSLALLSQLTTRFTKLKPDVKSHFTELADEDDADGEDGGQVTASSSSADARALQCPACGQELKISEAVACHAFACSSNAVHPGCLIACKKCLKNYCCQGCVDDHVCSG